MNRQSAIKQRFPAFASAILLLLSPGCFAQEDWENSYLATNDVLELENCTNENSICGFLQSTGKNIMRQQLCRCPSSEIKGAPSTCPVAWDASDGQTISHGNQQYKMDECCIGRRANLRCIGQLSTIQNLPRQKKERALSLISDADGFSCESKFCQHHLQSISKHFEPSCANKIAHKSSFKAVKHLHKISLNDFINNHHKANFIYPGAYLCNGSINCYGSLIDNPVPFIGPIHRSALLETEEFFKTYNALLESLGIPSVKLASNSADEETLQASFKLMIKKLKRAFENVGYSVVPLALNEALELKPSYDKMVANLRDSLSGTSTKSEQAKLLALVPKTISSRRASNLLSASRRHLDKARKPSGAITKKRRRSHHFLESVKLVKAFYATKDISSVSSSMRDRVLVKSNGKRISLQKRFMNMYIKDAYRSFIEEHPNNKVSFSCFFKEKPVEVIPMGKNTWINVCCCKKHMDVKLMYKAIGIDDSSSFYHKLVCDPLSKACMFRNCSLCASHGAILNAELEHILGSGRFAEKSTVQFRQWELRPYATIADKVLSKENFLAMILDKSETLLRHSYIVKTQNKVFQGVKSAIQNDNEQCVILADFAQNFTQVIQNEIQSAYYSRAQVTLHPFVVYYSQVVGQTPKPYSFCIVSDETRHNTNTFFSFNKVFLNHIKGAFPLIKKAHYFSDGCAGQYKNFKNFINLYNFESDFGIIATWNFFGSGHGKNSCDAVAGTVKRQAREACLYSGVILNDSQAFYTWASSHESRPKGVTFFHVSSDKVTQDVDEHQLEIRYSAFSTIQYTQRIHKVEVVDGRKLSFFELGNETTPLCEREIGHHMFDQIIFTENSVGEHFACLYEENGKMNWYPAEIVEVSTNTEEVKVQFYRPQRGGHFIKEGISSRCWVRFIHVVKAIPSPSSRSRRYYLDQALINDLNSRYPTL